MLPCNDWSEAPNPHTAGNCSWIGRLSKTWTHSRWDGDGLRAAILPLMALHREELDPRRASLPALRDAGRFFTHNDLYHRNGVLRLRACRTLLTMWFAVQSPI